MVRNTRVRADFFLPTGGKSGFRSPQRSCGLSRPAGREAKAGSCTPSTLRRSEDGGTNSAEHVRYEAHDRRPRLRRSWCSSTSFRGVRWQQAPHGACANGVDDRYGRGPHACEPRGTCVPRARVWCGNHDRRDLKVPGVVDWPPTAIECASIQGKTAAILRVLLHFYAIFGQKWPKIS